MAAFDIKPREQAPPNFLGYSRGIRADRNAALGTLFKGVAQAVDTGIQEADRFQKEQIREDIFDEVDRIQEEFGVTDATFIERSTGSKALPNDLERAGENLNTLQSAYERGALKESHYWARMNSMVRQLRSRYPGYRAEIDSMVSGITGARPANALRRALFSEWAQDSNTSPSALDKLVTSASNAGTLPAEYYERLESNNPFSFVELQERVSEKNRLVFEQRSADARMASAAASGGLLQEQTQRYARSTFTNFVNGIVSETLEAGGGYAEIRARIDESTRLLAEGKPLNQEQLQQDRALIGQLARDLELSLIQKSLEPFGEDTTETIASNLPAAEVAAMIEGALAPVRLLEKALASDNPNGVMTAMSAVNEARKEDNMRVILDQYPLIENLSSLLDVLDPQTVSLLLSFSQKNQEAFTIALSTLDVTNLLQRNTTVSDTAALASQVSEDAARSYIQSSLDILEFRMGADLPDNVMQAEVFRSFSPDARGVLLMLDNESQVSYFRQATSPQMTARMIELKRSGDIESFQMYQEFVTLEFRRLFSQEVTSLTAFGERPEFGVQFDPSTMSFIFDRQGFFGGAGSPAGEIGRDLNTVIRSIVPVIKEGGGDVPSEIAALLSEMGFREGQVSTEGFSGMVQKLLEAVASSVKSAPRLPSRTEGSNGN